MAKIFSGVRSTYASWTTGRLFLVGNELSSRFASTTSTSIEYALRAIATVRNDNGNRHKQFSHSINFYLPVNMLYVPVVLGSLKFC